jgi:PBP4 family serine-type D-alanyl-D-alanine carboxypeptidase
MVKTFIGAAAALLLAGTAAAQTNFEEAFARIRDKPEFKHSFFGVEVYSVPRGKVLYAYNADKLFQTGSTAKAVTTGTSLELLGPDFRYRTPVYRTGPVVNGVLKGDLVLVASGDPNLSSRLQADGTLAFVDEDHNYGGFGSGLVPGDPAMPLTKLAERVKAAGIHRVEGRVLIDIGLFAEDGREMGSGVYKSPIVVNDNVIDLVLTPGAPGAPATMRQSLTVPYLRFVNHVATVGKGGDTALSRSEKALPGGVTEVTLTGHIPNDRGDYFQPYPVPSPTRFAATLFAGRLAAQGVTVAGGNGFAGPVAKGGYPAANKVAEWVSAPLIEDVKVTLKTSQNLHASLMPYVWGGTLNPGKGPADWRGFALEREMLRKAGVDASGIMQANGEGSALFSPDFMAHFLAYMAGRPTFRKYHDAMPLLGRDGTLKDLMVDSPAAGQVWAKTGTHMGPNPLADGLIVNAKALAGYTTSPSGELLAVAIYLNNVPIQASPRDPTATMAAISRVTGTTLAEIAAAAHLYPIEGK